MAIEPNTVHSWHINIGTGDSAIHLLVQTVSGGIPIVHNAILIDGGLPESSAVDAIKATIQSIRARYDCNTHLRCDADNTTLRFDAIVVTHWDQDHYGGVFKLLQDDIKTVVNATLGPLQTASKQAYATAFSDWHNTKNHTPLQPDVTYVAPGPEGSPAEVQWKLNWKLQGDFLKELGSDKNATNATFNQISKKFPHFTVKSHYMRYDDTHYPATQTYDIAPATGAPIVPTTQVPDNALLTTFYCPYIGVNSSTQFATTPWCNAGSDGTNLPNTMISFFQSNTPSPYVDAQQNYLSLYVPSGYGLDIPTLEEYYQTGFTADIIVFRACKLCANFDQYLGVDLFRGLPCPAAPLAVENKPQNWKNMKDPSYIVSGWPQGRFGMVVVAGVSRILGESALMTPDTAEFDWNRYLVSTLETPPTSHSSSSSPALNDESSGSSNIIAPSSHHDRLLNFKPVLKAISKPIKQKAVVWDGDRAEGVTRNTPSIVCVLLSRTNDNTPSKSFKVHHYTAGDALYDVEGGVAGWLSGGTAAWMGTSGNPPTVSEWIQPATAMKISQYVHSLRLPQ